MEKRNTKVGHGPVLHSLYSPIIIHIMPFQNEAFCRERSKNKLRSKSYSVASVLRPERVDVPKFIKMFQTCSLNARKHAGQRGRQT